MVLKNLFQASNPLGIEIDIPHGIISFSHGAIVISLFIEAHKSTPEASSDWYLGNSKFSISDIFLMNIEFFLVDKLLTF